MTQLQYDGTMAGLLTAVFEVYDRKLDEVRVGRNGQLPPDAFAARFTVDTDAVKARRVWKGLAAKLPAQSLEAFYWAWLSEDAGIEDILLEYARYVFAARHDVTGDFGHAAVLKVAQTARKVGREKHRMEAFVRFEQLKDGLYYATVAPDHHVLPLIIPHFKSRYADQQWLIYDVKRKQGIHYDPEKEVVTEVRIDWDPQDTARKEQAVVPGEPLYQALWQAYFEATGIPERSNPRLQLQHMPLRYWKYLTEKRL